MVYLYSTLTINIVTTLSVDLGQRESGRERWREIKNKRGREKERECVREMEERERERDRYRVKERRV